MSRGLVWSKESMQARGWRPPENPSGTSLADAATAALQARHALRRSKPKPAVAVRHPLVSLCRAAGLPLPKTEFRFHPGRRWQFDYAFPSERVAVEVEGGIWRKGGGAHSHPSNIERDIEKYNAAAILGWRILRYAPEDLTSAIQDLQLVLGMNIAR